MAILSEGNHVDLRKIAATTAPVTAPDAALTFDMSVRDTSAAPIAFRRASHIVEDRRVAFAL